VFGMVIVNYNIVMGAAGGGQHWLLDAAGLVEGRAAALFVVLAGVGVSLMTRTGRISGDMALRAKDRATLLKRALFLLVVGLTYTPIWPADILHFYGLYIALGVVLLYQPMKMLGLVSALLVMGFMVLVMAYDYDAGWDWNTLDYTDLWQPRGFFRHLFFNGFHPVVPWAAFLVSGMALGRLDLTARETRRKVLFWGLGVAAVAEFFSSRLVSSLGAMAHSPELAGLSDLVGTAPMPPGLFYMVAAGGIAFAATAACVSLGLRLDQSRWIQPLVATGQLALTLYVAHVVVGMGLLDTFGYLENRSAPEAMGAAAVFCLLGVAFAHAWRSKFDRGPLEWLMRRVTK